MVSTFNEWHEDTQIEPTIVANPTTADSSGVGTYAQGYSYSGYGNLYLDLLHSATALPGDFSGNGIVNAGDYVVWRKGLGTIYTQNDYDVCRAHFDQTYARGSGASTNAAVPESSTLVLMWFWRCLAGVFAEAGSPTNSSTHDIGQQMLLSDTVNSCRKLISAPRLTWRSLSW